MRGPYQEPSPSSPVGWPSTMPITRFRLLPFGSKPCLKPCASSTISRSMSGTIAFSARPYRSRKSSGCPTRKRSRGIHGIRRSSARRRRFCASESRTDAEKLVDRRNRSWSSFRRTTSANSTSEWQTVASRAGRPSIPFTRLSSIFQLMRTKLVSSLTHLRWMFSRGAITMTRASGSRCRSKPRTPSAT